MKSAHERSLAGGVVEQHAGDNEVVRVEALVRRVGVTRLGEKRLSVVDRKEDRMPGRSTWIVSSESQL